MNDDAERIYDEALELDPAERAAFLQRECGENQSLLTELTSLLDRSADAERFFNSMSADVVPGMAADAVIGRTIGHYRIESHIDEGGMGSVYRAVDTRLDREVALKLLPATAGALAEARSAAAIRHPNICVIHDIGETDDGRPFIAMELCEGETLSRRLTRGRLAVPETLRIATQIANALGAAHSRGIIHGDIKPANVIVGSDGTATLLDFGLSRSINALAVSTGLHGTLPYMSPEQVQGKSASELSDIWSLGVVLYEMITGVRPFRGDNDAALVDSILSAAPTAISRLAPNVPSQLESIVEKLLAKEPSARYRDIGTLLDDLRSIPSRTPGGVRRWTAVSASAALTILAVGVGIQSWRHSPDKTGPGTAEQRRLTSNIAAYELYTRGRDPTLFRSDSGPIRGLAYLNQAVALDSTFAGAYAAMTYMYWVLSAADKPDSARTLRHLADSVAAKSVALDPTLPEAWMGLGVARSIGMSDLAGAEAAMKHAIALGGAPKVHEYLGKFLLWRGKIDEAVKELRINAAEDPLSATASAELGHALCLSNQITEGLSILDRLQNLQPPLRRVPGYQGECYMMQGRWQDAIDALKRTPLAPNYAGLVGYSLARSGDREAALKIKRGLETRWQQTRSGALDVAMIAAGLDDRDDFFKWLERSAASSSLYGNITSPFFSSMQSDPRYLQFRRTHRF